MIKVFECWVKKNFVMIRKFCLVEILFKNLKKIMLVILNIGINIIISIVEKVFRCISFN